MALDSQGRKPASESLENQGPQEPEIEISSKGRDLRFEEVNEVTWKLTDGKGINAWKGDRSGSYRATRAIGWLMDVGNGQWVVRYRNKASRPGRREIQRKSANSASQAAAEHELEASGWCGRVDLLFENFQADALRLLNQPPC
jgi:hypothetical protein